MRRGNTLQTILGSGNLLFQSICLCTLLFLLLLVANDQTRLIKIVARHQSDVLSKLSQNAKRKQADEILEQKFLSALRNFSAEIRDRRTKLDISSARKRDKYSQWIPHPEQEIASLSNNPYVIKNSDVCQGDQNVDFIVLIHSATGNFKKRQGIRNTWGNVTRLKQKSMKIVFLLGLTESNETNMKINKENSKYHDLVQGNFLDTYHNLTHKAVLGLRWVTECCDKARTVIKIDDDVFIDTVKLFSEFINMFVNKPNSIHCLRREANTLVLRSGKWKVKEDEFRNHKGYPLPYCAGFFTVMPTSVASVLYKAAYEVPFFWIDDFYVYGMLTDKAGVNSDIVDLGQLLSLHTYDSLNCFGMKDKRCNLLVGNAPSLEFMQTMWDKMLIQNKNVSRNIFIE